MTRILYVADQNLAATPSEHVAYAALSDLPDAKVYYPQGLYSAAESVRTVDEVACLVDPDDEQTVAFARPYVDAANRQDKPVYIVTIDLTGKAVVAPWTTPAPAAVTIPAAAPIPAVPVAAPVAEAAAAPTPAAPIPAAPPKGKRKGIGADPALEAELEAALKGK